MDTDRYAPVPAVEFSAVFNFRDLGGIPVGGSGAVRRGVLYRADGLFRLSEADLERYGQFGIRNVVDLRRPDELVTDGRIAELPDQRYHNISLQTAPWTAADLTAEQMPGYLSQRYAEMADEALASGAMGRVLRLLADEPGPTVFHCTAGKDRTGVVAALVLATVGATDEAVAADYAATQGSEEKYLAWRAVNQPHLPPYVSNGNYAPAEAMHTFLAGLRDRYGSVEAYTERAGLTAAGRAALRDRLVVS